MTRTKRSDWVARVFGALVLLAGVVLYLVGIMSIPGCTGTGEPNRNGFVRNGNPHWYEWWPLPGDRDEEGRLVAFDGEPIRRGGL